MANGSWASLRLEPVASGDKVALGSKAARLDGPPEKRDVEAATRVLLDKLADLQDAFHADGRHALLLVLQGRDASGKDGVIKTVYGAFNPTGVRVAAFGPPTPLELRHDFLWRVHQVVPPRGMIGVFNRSHYEDVLAVRVRAIAPESVWRPRFAQINAFEQMLTQNGVVIRKCLLHVSREEQRERLQARLDDPRKNWKFRLEDLDGRALWDAYTDAYRDVLTHCSTPAAPWYVVPSDDKAVRNYLIARMLVETLEALHPAYPPMHPDVRDAARDFR
ncbi:MAG: PPK2 family polyphosphate kinase [Gemmatimonas sp.]|uniref:PPK2 family polyphosphate kinase n=1 Tax=Gemmatimonas sp. TaxID=1962908 RepID=UPI00391F45A8|nr:polyphosphate kinase 2 family protein [Gemmatimonadota bacterium]